MEMPSPAMLDLARRLLAAGRSTEPGGQTVALVNEKLRIALSRFTGADGFAALLRRALKLASAESPALRSATVSADGRLEGLEQLAAHSGSVAHSAELAITSHLLGLLATFVGEKLTLRLVREACPEVIPDE